MDDETEVKRPRRSSVRMSLSAMNVAAEEKRNWLPPLVYLAHNLLTIVGLFLVNAAVVFWFFVLPVATQQGARHPYLMILFFGLIPLGFLIGLALIPLGIYLRYRRQASAGVGAREFLPLGWDNREFRHMSLFAVVATGCNVVLGGYFSQSTIHYMDSPGFCSNTCHTMAPQQVAFERSPHVNVDCVECHIGSGRRAYARAKLNGLWQVAVTLTDKYPRPIPTPLENLRPAREICESCHWPQKFSGIKLRIFDHFAEDSLNTHTTTVLALTVGGGPVIAGIHGFHVAPGVTIDFAADNTRQIVHWVRYRDAAETDREYVRGDSDSDVPADAEIRTMDCLDCHTRPSHSFEVPERALDRALLVGTVDSTVPWIRKRGLEILEAEYSASAAAERGIAEALVGFYRTEYPAILESQRAAIERSAQGLVDIYRRNVFPEMDIQWRTYPDNSGHTSFKGCFRCHGAGLRSPAGTSISSDCDSCHRILAFRERQPEILEQLGLDR